MAGNAATWRGQPFKTCLHGRLTSETRSFPVRVTGLWDDGMAVEGIDLVEVGEPFTVEIAFESDGDSAWNPKTSGPEFLSLFTARAVRAQDDPGQGSFAASFTDVASASKRVLDGYLAQLSRAREGRARGGALPRSPAFLAQADA